MESVRSYTDIRLTGNDLFKNAGLFYRKSDTTGHIKSSAAEMNCTGW
jgi:hypothetical protein